MENHDKAVRQCLFSNLTEAMESTQTRTPVPNALFFAPKQDDPLRANSSPLLIHSSGWANSCGSPSKSASNKNLRKPLEQVPWKLLEVVFNYVSVNLEVG